MPTADDEMARNCAKSFCENFLRAGGLRLVERNTLKWNLPAVRELAFKHSQLSIHLILVSVNGALNNSIRAAIPNTMGTA